MSMNKIKKYIKENVSPTKTELNDFLTITFDLTPSSSPNSLLKQVFEKLASPAILKTYRDYETLNKLIELTRPFYSVQSLNGNRSAYKKILEKKLSNNRVFKNNNKRLFNPEDSKDIRNNYKDKVSKRDEEDKYYINLSEILNFIETNIDLEHNGENRNTYLKHISIILGLGCRANEAMGEPFSKWELTENKNKIVMTHSKKQTRDGKKVFKPTERYTLIDADRILKAINDLSQHPTVKTKIKKLNKISYNNINNFIKSEKLLNFIPKPLKSIEFMRAIGMNSAYAKYAKSSSSKANFVKVNYGHKDLQTSFSYVSQLSVVNDISKGKAKEADLNKAQLNTINKKIDTITDDLKDIKITECSLNNTNKLSKEEKIQNIKLLMEKGYKSYASLKQFNYGSRIIKEAKATL